MLKNVNLKIKHIFLSLILILSAILNFWNLSIEGYGNEYYAAGVKSMLLSLKNFFFVASDPSGFVSIDKPPVGFWIQTISAKIFGFSGWSIILPQALAGVLSVALLYILVEKRFGSLSGLIAALCLAITPIFVAAGRNNTIDNQLVLCLLISCFFLLSAVEKGKVSHLIISLIIVGIGFNIKMAEAYMVLPAIYITYFLSSFTSFKKKALHLVVGSVVLIIVSLSWAFVVDLVPASNRPFVGSSTNNSVLELIIGHNGLERIGLKNKNLDFNFLGNNTDKQTHASKYNYLESKKVADNSKDIPFPNYDSIEGRALNGMGNSSKPGILRLFSNNNISDQISWLLPFALLGFISAALKEKLKYPFDNKRKLSLLLWILWLIPEVVYFSFTSGSFHTYYLTTMAPSIAALVGIGLSAMWDQYNQETLVSLFLPSAFLINGTIEVLILSYGFNKTNSYRLLTIFTAILCFSASAVLYLLAAYKKYYLLKNSTNPIISINNLTSFKKTFAVIAFSGIILAPAVWSFTPLFYRMSSSSPSAGLELSSNGEKATALTNDSKLISFLKDNLASEKYLVAVPSASYASDLILESGEPVMTIGGFSGSDKIITLNQFKQLVNDGELRYAIINGGLSKTNNKVNFLRRNSDNTIDNWIKSNGTLVKSSNWQPSTSSKNSKNTKQNSQSSGQLYDLSSAVN